MHTSWMLIAGTLIGCFSSGPSAPKVTPKDNPDGTPQLVCPEGTLQQSGTSASGEEEFFCQRAGVMHGPYLRFHRNGARAASGSYDNNHRHGQWTWWFENEQTQKKGKYDRGKQTGSWTWWHDNGSRQQEGDFLLGRRQGKWVTYYASGTIESEGMYHNDMRNDVWSYYEDDGTEKVSRTERFENGEIAEDKKPR